jgi:ubiquitin-like protein Pup
MRVATRIRRRSRGVASAQEIGREDTMASKDEGGQQRASRRTEEVDEVEDLEAPDVKERHEKLADDVDDILDEIDSVLEENSEEFVRSYVQKGGQ